MDTDGQPLKPTISPWGLSFIKRHEGCRLTAYRDPKGLWTIGHGHLLSRDEDHFGLTWTPQQALDQLLADTAGAQAFIRQKVREPLTQPQFDALVSLVFNIGGGHFNGSTVLTKINQKDYEGAAEAFLLWNDQGLLANRRREERAVFLYGTVS